MENVDRIERNNVCSLKYSINKRPILIARYCIAPQNKSIPLSPYTWKHPNHQECPPGQTNEPCSMSPTYPRHACMLLPSTNPESSTREPQSNQRKHRPELASRSWLGCQTRSRFPYPRSVCVCVHKLHRCMFQHSACAPCSADHSA